MALPYPTGIRPTATRRLVQASVVVTLLLALIAGLTPGLPSAEAAAPGTTEMVSRTSGGTQAIGSSYDVRTTADGRFAVFASSASLVAGDANGRSDAFLRDRQSGTTVMGSLTSTDVPGVEGGAADAPDVSDDGRFVVFASTGIDMTAGTDDNAFQIDIFLRDRLEGTTTRISNKDDGTQPGAGSYEPRISSDGQYVVFTAASQLVPADTDVVYDVYRYDRISGAVELVSLDEAGGQITSYAYQPDISADGQTVAFMAEGEGVAGGDTASRDVFVRDVAAGATELVSRTTAGAAVASGAGSEDPSISADGRYVVFESAAALTGADTNTRTDIYRHDRDTDETTRVSVTDSEAQVAGHDSTDADITADGNLVAFSSTGVLATGDSNGVSDVYIRDLAAGTSKRASLRTDGTQGTAASGKPELADDGSAVMFTSSSALATDDVGGADDVYAHTLGLVTTCLAPGPFPDVAYTHPFCEDIDWLVGEGITNGYPDGTFRPSVGLTRMAMAAFIYRFAGSPAFTPPATPTFTDVGINHPFRTEIEWMKAEGLSNGYVDGSYRPTAPITRMAMAAFLYRLAGSPPFTPPVTATFTDVPPTGAFFLEIEWVSASGLIDGFGDGTFRSTSTVTRARMAAFLHGFDEAGFVP